MKLASTQIVPLITALLSHVFDLARGRGEFAVLAPQAILQAMHAGELFQTPAAVQLSPQRFNHQVGTLAGRNG